MSQVKELLVEELQRLLDAETQLVSALPKMQKAAHNSFLKQAFEKHLRQTQVHVERLKQGLELLGTESESIPCRAMAGLVEEGQEVIASGKKKDEMAADLALIAAAQKVEHLEIASYGTVRTMARQIGAVDLATLLSHTLGEEESADYLLTEAAKPLAQQLLAQDLELQRA